MNMHITKEWLEKEDACLDGQAWFFKQKETNSIKVLKSLIKEDQWIWFRWLASHLMTHAQKVEWSIFCAEQVIEIFEKKYPKDKRPREAINAAKKWLKDPSEENKKAAADAYAAAAAADAGAAGAGAAAAAAAYAAAAAAAAADAYTVAAYAAAADAAADAGAAAARQKMRMICAEKAIDIIGYFDSKTGEFKWNDEK